MNLTPQEFYGISIRQYNKLIEGYEFRNRQEWERTAWQTMALLNIQLERKNKIKSIDELIGPSPKKQKTLKVKSKADFVKELKNLQERMKNAISK